jgi:hydrogenase maturation protein HypF
MAWSNGAQSVLGPHIGDQDTVTARERYVSQWSQWQELYRCEPQRIAHDLHPEYFSTEWAQAQELRCVAVQHHHAHVVSGMFEHGWLDQTVLGVAWDGTGYGTDGTIWGGEFLVCCARGFERFARLRPFRLPGGEAAIREPWRIALSVVADALGRAEAGRLTWPDVDPALRDRVLAILDHPHWSPRTSSAGRLFDAAAAIALGMARVEFEGQAAMILESMANRQSEGAYSLPLGTGELPELDWRPMFSALVCDCRAGVEPSVVSARFHRGLAEAIVRVCQQRPALPVVLSGGVFQNRLLTEWILESNAELAGRVGTPGIIPPNDGGLAAGQLAVAAMLEEVK